MTTVAEHLPVPATAARSSVSRFIGFPVTSLRRQLRAIANERENKEFLPSHLEILETAPTPRASAIIWLICIGLAVGLAASWVSEIDIFASSSGRIQPSGRSKVIQPFDAGKVKEVHVRNGDLVKAGDILVELEAADVSADFEAKRNDLASYDAEIARRTAEILAIRAGDLTAEINFSPDASVYIRLRERAVLAAELAQYHAARQSLAAQLAEKIAQRARLTASIAARKELIAVLQERVDMRQTLVQKSAGTRAAVIDAVQPLMQAKTDQAYDEGLLQESEAAALSLERKIDQLRGDSIAEQSQKLTVASQQRDRLQGEVVKSRVKLDRTSLTAPIAGTVQQLAITTVGQVVSTGQPLMVIVPSNSPIEIEALVLNRDIGFVEVGQQAAIKVDTFPFTRYGTIEGRVIRVSQDAIDQKDAAGSTDAPSIVQGQSVAPASGAPKTQNLVFPVTVKPDKLFIDAGGRDVPLLPGMTVTVEIHTGSRRVIDYLLAPLREVGSTAGRER